MAARGAARAEIREGKRGGAVHKAEGARWRQEAQEGSRVNSCRKRTAVDIKRPVRTLRSRRKKLDAVADEF